MAGHVRFEGFGSRGISFDVDVKLLKTKIQLWYFIYNASGLRTRLCGTRNLELTGIGGVKWGFEGIGNRDPQPAVHAV